MVKGISKQVIVVQSPGPELFEQAIFILKEKAVGEGVTDELLMKQAQQVIRGGKPEKKRHLYLYGVRRNEKAGSPVRLVDSHRRSKASGSSVLPCCHR